MEMKTNRAVITAAEPAGSILQEQGVELDYVLPDYYPDVCKLVKCFITPTVLSDAVSGDRLSYELRAECASSIAVRIPTFYSASRRRCTSPALPSCPPGTASPPRSSR